MSDIGFVIRQVSSIEDTVQIEEVQKLAWGMPDMEVIPSRFMHALEHNGALLLGAYAGERIVGFSFGLLGLTAVIGPETAEKAGPLHIYSAITGIVPEYQTSGVGYALKMTQRELALKMGIRLITWTYDPLESRNGYFNVNKLGVVCGRYLRNFHGEMGGINAGLPTDRFYVEWWLDSGRVDEVAAGQPLAFSRETLLAESARIINAARRSEDNLPLPAAEFVQSDNPNLLAEIPADFQRLKRQDMNLAIKWRQHTRRLFEHYFEGGYQVTGFVRHDEDEVFGRSYYLLEKNTDK
jgi:predicted GNAT superfamily acetyltransferase